jgi:hypothetical protein
MEWKHKSFWGKEYQFRVSSVDPMTFSINFQALEESGSSWVNLSELSKHMSKINKIWGYDPLDVNKISNDAALEIYIDHLAEDDLKTAFPNNYKKYKISLLDH